MDEVAIARKEKQNCLNLFLGSIYIYTKSIKEIFDARHPAAGVKTDFNFCFLDKPTFV